MVRIADNFKTFSKSFELNLEKIVQKNPFLVVPIKDLIAKSSKLHCQVNQLLQEI